MIFDDKIDIYVNHRLCETRINPKIDIDRELHQNRKMYLETEIIFMHEVLPPSL